MGLTATQRSIVSKAQAVGGGGQGIALDDATCVYLVGIIAKDLSHLEQFPELPGQLPEFFGTQPLESLRVEGVPFLALFERIVGIDANADMYFACLSALHKHRLKYERILKTQAIPTIDEVGPRGLLQYGSVDVKALAPFLLWRKWIFNIDNRAAQETGYLFEPIIANAIGGTPASAGRSPVKRVADRTKGRQVDCLRDKKAHEIKLRVTMAASGQGRWGEELEFPADCEASGFTPVLVVLDPTPNDKLDELSKRFREKKGEVYIGQEAWNYLTALAGSTMSVFLERYVHQPLQELLKEMPTRTDQLPDLTLRLSSQEFAATIAGHTLIVNRSTRLTDEEHRNEMPEDADDAIPGP